MKTKALSLFLGCKLFVYYYNPKRGWFIVRDKIVPFRKNLVRSYWNSPAATDKRIETVYF